MTTLESYALNNNTGVNELSDDIRNELNREEIPRSIRLMLGQILTSHEEEKREEAKQRSQTAGS